MLFSLSFRTGTCALAERTSPHSKPEEEILNGRESTIDLGTGTRGRRNQGVVSGQRLRSRGGFAGVEFGSVFYRCAGLAEVWLTCLNGFEIFFDSIKNFIH